VNRSLPKFEPPRTTLEFSASPTEEEFLRARVFVEPLVPVGGKPTAEENSDLAAALLGYAKRSGQDDFASLTDFLDKHPKSPWVAALLTGLGFEYYNTAHYSLAVDAWSQAWPRAKKDARDANGIAIADLAVSELAYMDARLGRTTELEALLKSLNGRVFRGSAAEKISGAREGLWIMQNRPQVAFRCGPLALHRIKHLVDPKNPETDEIFNSASTQRGFSLPQVAELSKRIGLNYQMAFREPGGAFVVPSVVHWKLGHYAALVRQEGNLYLLQDPTFRNNVWATRQALESETSGYFLIPPGTLPQGWRAVEATEGGSVWGKGQTSNNDPAPITPDDPKTQVNQCEGTPAPKGMPVPSVHLMDVNLSLVDEPLGYTPPVGPPVRFTVRYNSRNSTPLEGPYDSGAFGNNQWTCDYFASIVDDPSNPLADVTYNVGGGGYRTFTGFNTNTQSFDYEQYDETLLTRTGTNSYELLARDGSKLIFTQSDGGVGTTRSIFLTQEVDAQGNSATLTYDSDMKLVAITDAIGQVTTLSYNFNTTNANGTVTQIDPYRITQVTDPFGRAAFFDYEQVPLESIYNFNYVGGDPTLGSIGIGGSSGGGGGGGSSGPVVGTGVGVGGTITNLGVPIYTWDLAGITDVIGLHSHMDYVPVIINQYLTNYNVTNEPLPDLLTFYAADVNSLTTPYGTTTFLEGQTNTTRFMETTYPDGSRDRVEYNQQIPLFYQDPAATVPVGMNTFNLNLGFRNTYYWSRNACASSYGDYTKAKVYHWLHTEDLSSTSGILESTKEPLENRVWLDYAGQGGYAYVVGNNNLPTHVGRVLDDGSTQLSTYAYDGFGHLTNSIDPLGRTLSYVYATNGIDLIEVRQTRAGNNDLLFKATYNSQHRPLTRTDAAGQMTTFTYNPRGQILTATDPKNETATFNYDTNGYLLTIDGPLPGTSDVVAVSYDACGRIRTETDFSGYTLTFDYDNLDRLTRITYPDGTFSQCTY
jgi:YD repeat-containing protein